MVLNLQKVLLLWQVSLSLHLLNLATDLLIIKDHFKIDGSDTAQIGWVETTDEAGQTGFLGT